MNECAVCCCQEQKNSHVRSLVTSPGRCAFGLMPMPLFPPHGQDPRQELPRHSREGRDRWSSAHCSPLPLLPVDKIK